MMEELRTASSLLSVALERYINACFVLRDGHSYKNNINSTVDILDAVHNEIDQVESYKTKLAQAQVAVRRARNNLAKIPINSLPAEVLTHIFHLVSTQQPCLLRVTNKWGPDNLVHLPKYPDTLSHVCSHWRETALASHALWSHIDIGLSCSLSQGFHDRAAAYVTRAHEVPLDIHLLDPGLIREEKRLMLAAFDSEAESEDLEGGFNEWDDLMYESNANDFTFLGSSPGFQIRSLELLVYYRYHPIHSRAFEHCLANCFPNGPSELVINVLSGILSGPHFFEASSDLQYPTSNIQLLLSEQQLERAWGSVTNLNLQGRYPRWTSIAYHGLTNLRLFGKIRISSSALAGILLSSPGLRTICCDFRIRDLRQLNAPTFTISLQELETLNLKGMDEGDVDCFLRWINPGPKPLRLLLFGNPTSALLNDFFARSNVQEMHVQAEFGIQKGVEMPFSEFCLPPQLRILVLIHWGWKMAYGSAGATPPPSLGNEMPSPKELDTVFLLSCCYDDFHQLQEIMAKYSPQRLVLWKCEMGDGSQIDLPLLESALGNSQSQLCPTIECLSYQDPRPIRDLDWDLD